MPTLVELLVATAIIGTLAITDAKASTETSGPAARTKTIQPHRIDVKNEPTVDTKDQIDTAASIWSQIGWKLQFLPEIIHSEAFSYPGISIPIDLMSNIFVTEAAARQGNRGRLLTAEQYAAIGTYITYNNTRASQAGSDVNVWFAPGWVYEATGYGGFGTPNAATKLAAKTCGIPWGVGCELPQGIYIGAKASGPRTLAHELYHYFTGFGGEALPGNCGTINGNSPGCYKTPAEERDPARNRFPPWVKRLLP